MIDLGKSYVNYLDLKRDYENGLIEDNKIFFWRGKYSEYNSSTKSGIYGLMHPTEAIIIVGGYLELRYNDKSGKELRINSISRYDIGGYYHIYTKIEMCIEEYNEFISNVIKLENNKHEERIGILTKSLIL